jgi:uncharacterized protein YqgC (DUF456 family)
MRKSPYGKFPHFSLLLPLLSTTLTGCSGTGGLSQIFGVGLPPTLLTVTQVVIFILMILGLFSLLTYIIPGLTIIWLCALVYALLIGLTWPSGILFGIISLLMIFGNTLDQFFMGGRAKKSGASWSTIILSTIAAIIFSFLLPPFGGLIAAMFVLFVLEFIRLKDWRKAGGSTKEMAIGCATAIAARFGVGIVMIGVWVLWVWLAGDLPF